MILKILKFFIAVTFIFFLFMVIVQLDMGMKKYFGDKNEQDQSQSLFTL